MIRSIILTAMVAAWSVADAVRLEAQSLRVLNVDLAGTSMPSEAVAEVGTRASEMIADAARAAEAEVLVVSGVPSRTTAQRLAVSLKAPWQLVLQATFADGVSNRANGTAIFSRRAAFAARSAEWRAAGQVEVPGGFAFAGFRSGTNTFCLYVADFPGDASGSSALLPDPLAGRKREMAAQYLLHHAHWIQSTLTNQSVAFAVLADLGLDAGGGFESAGRALQQAGFGAWLAPKNAGTVASPYSVVLARQAVLLSAPRLMPAADEASRLCLYDLGRPVKQSPAPGGVASGRSGAQSASSSVIWIWAGVLGGVTVITLGIRFALRHRPVPEVFKAPEEGTSVIDVSDSPFAGHGEDAAAGVRAGLMGQVRSLLGERLVSWLAAQRGRLLVSHDRGTKQVAELEERLLRIQGHFEDQMKSRDQRILELEREIQAREEMIRRLLLARTGQSDLRPPE